MISNENNESTKWLSLLGFAAIVVSALLLLQRQELFSRAPRAIALQIAAALLMVWARLTFGMRSFHADAGPTAGGLVTSGPYRFLRHPIYFAILLFIWVGVIAHFSPLAVSLGALATAGAILRLLCEERLLRAQYPEYRDYAGRTKRLLPGVW